MEILCFYAGIAFACTQSLLSLLFVIINLILRPSWPLLIWFFAAIFFGFFHQWLIADSGMPAALVIPKASLEGQIMSIPLSTRGKVEFQFLATRLNNKPVKAILQLSCYNYCPVFKVGQFWQLQAKLKRPVNLSNPGGFDYVSWLSARHIKWVGYLRPSGNKLVERPKTPYPLLTLREHLAATLSQAFPKTDVLGVLQALSLGITTHLDRAQWDLFRRTGTTHLMVISGAHIGLVAGLTYGAVRGIWSRFGRLCLYRPAAQVGSIMSLLMASVYALLAGFAPSAQRSLFACFFLLLRHFLGYRFNGWQAWRYGLLAVMLYEPHVVLFPGFYLSFIAVAILIVSSQRIPYQGMMKTLGLQLACLFGLMPLTLYWFSYGAINGLVANLVAIPWVGFVVVPLSLFSVLLAQWVVEPWLMWPVKTAIEALLHYLRWVDSFSCVNLEFSFAQLLSPLSIMLGMALLFVLPIKKMYFVAAVLIGTGFFPGRYQVKENEARINVLDVGQGLAVVVNTANHTLIYDTGVQFYQGGDMGKLVIIPFLNTLGVKKLDKVIISHPDLDHRGGLPSLEKQFPITELVVDNLTFYHRGSNCHRYRSWVWDGVQFRFFGINKIFKDKNNTSCVLQIENNKGSVLLTGDIEKSAENYLVETYGSQLASTILVVPHHGSKTSSTELFIKQVAPKYAIISAGFDNRYHFPHPRTLNTLEKQQVTIFSTMEGGMVTVDLPSNSQQVKPTYYQH